MKRIIPYVAVYIAYYVAYVLLGLSDAVSTAWLMSSGAAFELNIRVEDPSLSGVMQGHLIVGLMFAAFPTLSLAMMLAPERIREMFEFHGTINAVAMRVPGAVSLWVLAMLIGASVNNWLGVLAGVTPMGMVMHGLGYDEEIEAIAAFQIFVLCSMLILIVPCYKMFGLISTRLIKTFAQAGMADMPAIGSFHGRDRSVEKSLLHNRFKKP